MASVMRFDEWQNTLGVSAVSIDSTGRLSYPNMPIISGQIGSIGTFSGAQKVPFDEFWVQRGITYDSGTRRFTIPKTGIYRVTMNPFQNTGVQTRVMIGVNSDTPSTANHRGMCFTNSSGYNTLSLNSVIPLTSGDYVVFYLSEGSLYNGSSDRFNQFSIEMIA